VKNLVLTGLHAVFTHRSVVISLHRRLCVGNFCNRFLRRRRRIVRGNARGSLHCFFTAQGPAIFYLLKTPVTIWNQFLGTKNLNMQRFSVSSESEERMTYCGKKVTFYPKVFFYSKQACTFNPALPILPCQDVNYATGLNVTTATKYNDDYCCMFIIKR